MEPQNIIYGLYCVCSDCGERKRVRYVGQAKSGLKLRLANHLTPKSLNAGHAVSEWKLDHGPKNIRALVLEAEPENLDESETAWATRLETYLGESDWGLNGATGSGPHYRMAEGYRELKRLSTKRGEEAPNSRLTWDQVRWLRSEYSGGGSVKDMAQELGISFTTARHIVYNLKWYDPGYTYARREVQTGDSAGATKISVEVATAIRDERRRSGKSYRQLSEEFGVGIPSVTSICLGKRKGIEPA